MYAFPYDVEKGDTLASVAEKHGITKEELIEANGFKKGTRLKEGETIAIPYEPEPEFAAGQKVKVKDGATTVYSGHLAKWGYELEYTVLSVNEDGVGIGVSGTLVGVFAPENLFKPE